MEKMDKKMDTITIVVSVFTIIGVVLSTALWMQNRIDRKIEEKIKEPSFVKKIADEVRLPFVIFDDNNRVIADYGAYQYLNEIHVLKDKDKKLTAIEIKPKQFMSTPPIVENINGSLDFFEPERQEQITWKININSINTDSIITDQNHTEPVYKFKLTIFR